MHNHIELKDKTSLFYLKITGCPGLVLELFCMIACARVGYRQMNLKQDLSLCCMFPLNYNEIKSKDHVMSFIDRHGFLNSISVFSNLSLSYCIFEFSGQGSHFFFLQILLQLTKKC